MAQDTDHFQFHEHLPVLVIIDNVALIDGFDCVYVTTGHVFGLVHITEATLANMLNKLVKLLYLVYFL